MASVTDKLLTLSQAFKLYCQREGFVHLRDDEQPTRESTIQRKQLASDFKDNFQQMKMCLRLKNLETGEEVRLKPGEWPETPHNAPLAFHGHVIAPHWNSEWHRYSGFEIYVVRADFDDWLENEPRYRIQSEMYFQRRPSTLVGEVPLVAQHPSPEPVPQTAIVKMDKAELEAAYIKRRDNWPTDGSTSSLGDDWDFLKSLKPDISRDRARELRRELAPKSWTKKGKRKLAS